MKRYNVTVNGKQREVILQSRVGSNLAFSIDGESYSVNVDPILDHYGSSAATPNRSLLTTPQASQVPSKVAVAHAASAKDVVAPMPGIIVSITANVDQAVNVGDIILVMEAMKMENNITAHRAGTLSAVLVKAGQEVQNGQKLAVIE